MSVNIEGYVSQTGAASGWYQNGRAVSAQEKEKDSPETAGQKMKRLAQAWTEAYKTSGSKESGMEKVLSMLNDMFGIRKEA